MGQPIKVVPPPLPSRGTLPVAPASQVAQLSAELAEERAKREALEARLAALEDELTGSVR